MIVTNILDKTRISLKSESGKNLKIKPNHLGAFTNGSYVENFIEIEAF